LKFKENLLFFVQQLKNSCLHLFYPTRCLHCRQLLEPQTQILCQDCSLLLTLIDPEECCAICFNVLNHCEISPCQKCRKTPSLYHRLGAAFDYEGPAALLVQRLKYANQPYLAEGMAAFLLAQVEQLQWPLPDILIPVPLSRLRWLERGYNQTALIADALGQMIQRPVLNILKRRSGDYRQASLSYSQRQNLAINSFWLEDSFKLHDQVIWVIDDVMTSGATLRRCAETLSQGGPAKLYGLTFCRTLNL
jgi:ComF family protein